ncbi:aldo/keto reductase family protein [Aspergillus neoniger CBS 115656]|uniref:Aldo/keto reductase n=1 Tax=Aspergillus neoniger (strain CBS 115656) TaxID=1448310 RepID=A0A318YQT8_ASPNB|nr:aldo/keto reductase [Aspergillus neoniger CBS 115656]PYH36277.1 aldo/keto reductase [Aspergillus neoniger CBS 115656]
MPEVAGKEVGTCWNGGENYGALDYNSLVLVEQYLEKYPEYADKIVLNIKGGVNPDTHQIDASAENTRRSLDNCIAQLKGRKKIDMFEFARRDPAVPMQETFDLIEKEYVQTGKIEGIALSEVRAETIHEAVKYTKVLAVEAEISLFTTDILENGVAAACAQYGIPIIAYSPIGRGMLTGQFKKFDDLPQDSLLRSFDFPRFQRENFEKNMQLVEKVEDIAQRKGSLSRRPGVPTIIPIPGATTAERVEENSKLIEITDEEMQEIDDILVKFTPAGERYPRAIPVNT